MTPRRVAHYPRVGMSLFHRPERTIMNGCCTTCPRTLTPAEADRYACQACVYRMRTWLTELPAELDTLTELLQPAGGHTQGSIHGGRAHSPAPLRLDVLNLIGPGDYLTAPDPGGDQDGTPPVLAVLTAWAQYIATQYPTRWTDAAGTVRVGPSDDMQAVSRHGTTTAAWCSWLAGYLGFAADQAWVRQLYAELQDLMIRVRDITQSQIRTRIMRAPCPLCGTFALTAKDGEWYIDCQACPEVLDRDYYTDEYEPQALAQYARDALAQHAAKAAAVAAPDRAAPTGQAGEEAAGHAAA